MLDRVADPRNPRSLIGSPRPASGRSTLFAPLPHEHLVAQVSSLLSPPLWDLGHIGAYEELWLARRVAGHPPLHPELDDVYDAFETPRPRRGDVGDPRRGRRATSTWRAVRERSLEALAASDLDDPGAPLLARGLRLRDGGRARGPAHRDRAAGPADAPGRRLPAAARGGPCRPPAPARGGEWCEIPAGSFAMGAGDEGFAYDCERPRHARVLDAFRIARDPGRPRGSGSRSSTTAATGAPSSGATPGGRGGAPRTRRRPLYWERDGEGGWLARAFERVAPVDPGSPVCHVSAHEADAFARWAGCRLPTEAEWERAAAGRRRRAGRRPTSTSSRSAPPPRGAYPALAERLPPDDRRRLGVDLHRLPRLPGLPRLPVPRVLRGLLRRRATGCCAAAPGRRSRSPRGRASATGTCPSAARSSAACAWRRDAR